MPMFLYVKYPCIKEYLNYVINQNCTSVKYDLSSIIHWHVSFDSASITRVLYKNKNKTQIIAQNV